MQYTIRLRDKWLRLIGIPFIAFMSHLIFFNENHRGPEIYSYWQVLLISMAEGILLWETNRLVLLYFHNRYPLMQQSGKRIWLILLSCMFVTILIRYVNIWFYDKTLFWGYLFPREGYFYNILIALLYVIIMASVYEGIFYFRQWKRTLQETEALKRENLETQLQSLKVQINPHFLFNNLGSLSSLVMEDQKKAVLFIRELSSVYRYLLQANEKHLTSLKAELEFIDHYFHLLKTRFAESVRLDTHIADQYLERLIPPLTLQLLVENAIKHNAILPNEPLIITLSVDDSQQLVVSNTIRSKATVMETSKLGLRNIREKYRLLGYAQVQVSKRNDLFVVAVPLIKNQQL